MSERFIDVLLIARSIIKEVERSKGTPITLPVPLVDGILPAIESNLGAGFRIKIERREWPSMAFRSALFRYTDHADIIYSHSLNICWRRFSICKEAAHLLIDDSNRNHFTTDVEPLISGLITSAPMLEPDTHLESERMGVVAAIELLLPWSLREQIEQQKDNRSDLEIAEQYRVPEKFVNAVLRMPYGQISKKLNAELDQREGRL